MLFSEPKISQIAAAARIASVPKSFSALQRAENFSNSSFLSDFAASSSFQCSSASRKFLKFANVSEQKRIVRFQCSSASRKFLKRGSRHRVGVLCEFQCSSASRKFLKLAGARRAVDVRTVSVLFSEPKISQTAREGPKRLVELRVSVLFSEPKISQTSPSAITISRAGCFSALQRAENFSNVATLSERLRSVRFSALQRAENFSKRSGSSSAVGVCEFQCSSASRKFLKLKEALAVLKERGVSVLFSEPKISQTMFQTETPSVGMVSVLFSEPKISQSRVAISRERQNGCFSALQRAENFSNVTTTRPAVDS